MQHAPVSGIGLLLDLCWQATGKRSIASALPVMADCSGCRAGYRPMSLDP